MKKFLGKAIGFFIASTALLGFFSCSDSDDDSSGSGSNPNTTNPLSYTNLSVGRAYMGGSLIYNPEDSSTNQLSSGTVIAIREGTVTPTMETQQVYEYQDSYGSNQMDTKDLTTVSKSVWVLQDEPSLAIYGYIKIDSVSKDSISFKYTRFNKEGTSSSDKSYTIKYGEELDFNDDGYADIKYREPDAKRDGFEGARWLEFVCDSKVINQEYPKATSTTMFSVVTAKELSGSAECLISRSADGASVVEAESGLYGVNSNGNYVYLVKSNGSVNSGSDSANLSDYSLKYGDYVIVCDESTATNAGTDNSTESFVVSYQSDDTNSTTLNNGSFTNVYTYSAKQFQDEEGPADLLSKLPAALLVKVESSWTAENAQTEAAALTEDASIIALNKILDLGSEATDLLIGEAVKNKVTTALTDSEKTVLDELLAKNKVQAVRRIIDSLYSQSPKADLMPPSIDAMYPYLAMDLGDKFSKTVEEENINLSDSARVAMAATAKEYKAQKKAIEKKFEDYFAIDIKKVTVGKKTEDDGSKKDNDLTLKDYGIKLSLGLKGKLSITGSSVDAGIGGVVFISVNLSLAEQGFNQLKAMVLDPINEAIKDGLKSTVMIGVVPVTLGAGMEFDCEFSVDDAKGDPVDLVFGYTGMYGGGVNVGANWGVEWKGPWFFKAPCPYLRFHGDSYKVNETAWMFGSASGKSVSEIWSDSNKYYDITLTPSFEFSPTFGIGPKWANISASLPITTELPLKFYWHPRNFIVPLLHEVDIGLKIEATSGAKLKVLIFSLSHTFFKEELYNQTGDNAWVLWKWDINDIPKKTLPTA
ncbi:MAG: hypothetical protein K5873_02885 [Treponema sp.]|nr:hypothetical protein [Treponema sp.]